MVGDEFEMIEAVETILLMPRLRGDRPLHDVFIFIGRAGTVILVRVAERLGRRCQAGLGLEAIDGRLAGEGLQMRFADQCGGITTIAQQFDEIGVIAG